MAAGPVEEHGDREHDHDGGGRREQEGRDAGWHHLRIASLSLKKTAKLMPAAGPVCADKSRYTL
jgi:hypothetical protein